MTQKEDLDAAIAAEDVQIQALVASVAKIADDVTALLAKIAGGTSAADLANEIAAVQSHTASLTTAAAQLADSDTKANG